MRSKARSCAAPTTRSHAGRRTAHTTRSHAGRRVAHPCSQRIFATHGRGARRGMTHPQAPPLPTPPPVLCLPTRVLYTQVGSDAFAAAWGVLPARALKVVKVSAVLRDHKVLGVAFHELVVGLSVGCGGEHDAHAFQTFLTDGASMAET